MHTTTYVTLLMEMRRRLGENSRISQKSMHALNKGTMRAADATRRELSNSRVDSLSSIFSALSQGKIQTFPEDLENYLWSDSIFFSLRKKRARIFKSWEYVEAKHVTRLAGKLCRGTRVYIYKCNLFRKAQEAPPRAEKRNDTRLSHAQKEIDRLTTDWRSEFGANTRNGWSAENGRTSRKHPNEK